MLLLDSSWVDAHLLKVMVLERSHSEVVLHPVNTVVVAARRLLALPLVELGRIAVLEHITLRHTAHCFLAKLRLWCDHKILVTWLRVLVLRTTVAAAAKSLRVRPIELKPLGCAMFGVDLVTG